MSGEAMQSVPLDHAVEEYLDWQALDKGRSANTVRAYKRWVVHAGRGDGAEALRYYQQALTGRSQLMLTITECHSMFHIQECACPADARICGGVAVLHAAPNTARCDTFGRLAPDNVVTALTTSHGH